MTPEDFISILENGDFFDATIYQELLKKYPYAQGLRLAYLQQLKKYNPDAYKIELNRMAVYAPSRTALYYSLKRKEDFPEEILPLPIIKQENELQVPESIEVPEKLEEIIPDKEIEREAIQEVIEKEENEYIEVNQEQPADLTEEEEESALEELDETLEQLLPALEFAEEEEEEVEDHSNLLLQQIIISTQKVKEHEHHHKEALPENGFVSDEELEMLDDEVEWGILDNLNVDTELYSDTKEDISKFKKKKKKKAKKKHHTKSDEAALLFAFIEDNENTVKEEDKTFEAVDEIISADNLLVFNDDEATVKPHQSILMETEKLISKKKKKQQVKKILTKISEQDLEEDEGLISETLAKILASQGKKSHAIKMYKKLIIKKPNRSAYFLEKIKELI